MRQDLISEAVEIFKNNDKCLEKIAIIIMSGEPSYLADYRETEILIKIIGYLHSKQTILKIVMDKQYSKNFLCVARVRIKHLEDNHLTSPGCNC